MSDESWKDTRVRQAEAALSEAVRTADELVAAAEQDARRAEKSASQPQQEEPEQERQILRDAW